ncbi:MbtH family NRPS accessory protein [Methylomonas koyamae]|uniref:MbtH family protein n=1 Tax=Methylomonas koyamae TaxID=702114 RepID=UPI0021B19407|nr:MbtH family NRPS accessory protein [Methylomonas koyamae]
MAEELETGFVVVCNHEQQHALWPAFKPVPAGWQQVKPADSRENCLDYVNRNWPDIRPLSLRTL